MITKEILEAQLALYQKGKKQAEADINSFAGAIDAIANLLRILGEFEAAQAKGNAQTEEPPPKKEG